MFQRKRPYELLQRGKHSPSMVENVSKDDSEEGGKGNDAGGLDVKQLFFSDFVATISSNHIITTAWSCTRGHAWDFVFFDCPEKKPRCNPLVFLGVFIMEGGGFPLREFSRVSYRSRFGLQT